MARNQTPQKASWDLLLKGGHVLDPARNLDGPADIAMAGGKIAAVGTGLPRAKAKEVRNVAGRLLTPGLIDLHTHVYWGGASCGVDADRIARRSATTTSVDAGTTGAGNFRGFRHHVIERSDSRILAFINLSFPGIFGFAHDLDIGEAKDLSYLNRKHCIEMAEANADLIVGIKIRMGVVTTGQLGMKPLARAKAAAAAIGKPIMAHISKGPPAYGEVLKALRPGDILTHCFRPAPNGPVTPSGTINRELLRARDRGVIMDIGHGKGSFGFTAARRLLDAGIMPDVIS
ncbi:MAG: amidohydrolase/deacetylase family metallohydrolase, partial [Alphaproteobacteria bacterium]